MPKYVTQPILEHYNEKIKEYILDADTAVLEEIKEYANAINEALDERISLIENSYDKTKFEIFNAPEGALVNYNEGEIRVMCPIDTKWVKQNVGSTGNASMYYMSLRAYAPENAVSFKEGDSGIVIDEIYTFDDDFAGIDEFGRKYSVVWLALASYQEETDTWIYFGKNSSTSKYVGWDYVVEWYDNDNKLIAFDSVRINLSNENCHFITEPYYMDKIIETTKAYIDTQVEEKIAEVEVAPEIFEF